MLFVLLNSKYTVFLLDTFVLIQKYPKNQDGANVFDPIKISKYKQYISRVGKFKASFLAQLIECFLLCFKLGHKCPCCIANIASCYNIVHFSCAQRTIYIYERHLTPLKLGTTLERGRRQSKE